MSTVKAYNSFMNWLGGQFVRTKLNSPLGYIVLLTLAAILAYVVASVGIKIGALILVVIIVLPSILLAVFDLNFGIKMALVASVLVGFLSKIKELPFGLSLDALLFVMFFGLLIKQSRVKDLSFAKSPISALILIWVSLNLFEVLNPAAISRLAWIFTVRSMAGLILLYFIACYAFNSAKAIFSMLKFIIFLAFISALYGLKQEFFGFSEAEMVWLYSDKKRLQLILQWGRLRIFSFFSDPTNYGIFMAYMSTFCFILSTGPFKLWKRFMLIFGGVLMIMGMAYAGSRTPFVLVPFGLMVFLVMTLKKEYIIVIGAVCMLGGVVIMKSSSNAVMYRIQSAFVPSKANDTMDVRNNSRKFIQPYVYRHPLGFGLGSTGVWAARFTPDSFLANFAHDSGYLRVAVELGWIGLIVICLLLFMILRTSIYYYIRVKDPKIKVIYLGITVVFFQLSLANFPQEALTILPTSIIFYLLLAITVKLKDFDTVALNAAREQYDDDTGFSDIEDLSENNRGLTAN